MAASVSMVYPLTLLCVSSDQIDENLKLTLQEDLTSMAPGLIIQVLKLTGRERHGRREGETWEAGETILREFLHTSINIAN